MALDLPALTAASSEVVRARVLSSRAEWSGDHRRLVTRVEVEILETWKGNAAARLTVVQPGGQRDGLVQHVSGVAALEPGQQAVLFLARTGPHHRVVGLAQGVYRVAPDSLQAEPRAMPASVEDLTLVAPAGRSVPARTPLLLSELRQQVQDAR